MIAVVVALLVSGLVLWVFARLVAGDARNVRLGTSVFMVGNSERLALRVDRDGPIFFNDLVKEDDLSRPVVLAHVKGDDWAALNARPLTADRDECVVRFDRVAKNFVDPCTEHRYGVDGRPITVPSGRWLARYETQVSPKGALSINLNKLYPQQLRERS